MKRAAAKGAAAKRREGIGFSQRIRLDWLEYAANAVLVGSPEGEIVAALRERLRARFSLGGGRVSGNRDKAASILTRVGVTVPDERRPLRDDRRRTGHPHHAIYRTAGCGPPRVSIRDGYLPGRNTPTVQLHHMFSRCQHVITQPCSIIVFLGNNSVVAV